MTTTFLLQNQNKQLLTKGGEWGDGRDANALFRTPYKDEALNQMVEVNSKDYTLRIHILECEVSPRGVPLVGDEHLPPMQLSGDEEGAANDDECQSADESKPQMMV